MIDHDGTIDDHDEPDDIAQVADALIAERGGPGAFSVAQIAAARRLAMALCSEQPTSSSLSALLELLPARQDGTPADLTRLSDDQFRHLDYLLAVARGEPAVNPTRERRRKKSLRSIEAAQLVALLDKIANAKRAPSVLEITEIKNSITAMLYGAAPLPYVLFQTSITNFEQLLAPPPKPTEVKAPAAPPPNVTRLPTKEAIC